MENRPCKGFYSCCRAAARSLYSPTKGNAVERVLAAVCMNRDLMSEGERVVAVFLVCFGA